MANHQRDPRKERFWRRMLRQWRRSGLTIREFCSQHQLSEPSFYAWRSAIAQRDQERAASPAEPTATHVWAEAGPLFVPLCLPASAAVLELVLPDGLVLRVPSGFDPVTLQQLLGALRQR